MKVHFLAFADSKYEKTKERIRGEAIDSNFFDIIQIYGESDLPENIRKYCTENHRGYGFWSWKPFIVEQYLNEIDSGDILVYCDIGCTINLRGSDRFSEYLNALKTQEIVVFKMPHLESMYTKMDTLIHFDAIEFSETGQVAATAFCIKKTKTTEIFCRIWNDTTQNHKNLIDDSISITKNSLNFIDHRHDQSIFSILCKKGISDVCFFEEDVWMMIDEKFDDRYPIHGARLKY